MPTLSAAVKLQFPSAIALLTGRRAAPEFLQAKPIKSEENAPIIGPGRRWIRHHSDPC